MRSWAAAKFVEGIGEHGNGNRAQTRGRKLELRVDLYYRHVLEA
jgi:hypothetical protein